MRGGEKREESDKMRSDTQNVGKGKLQIEKKKLVITIHITNKGLVSRMYKELL